MKVYIAGKITGLNYQVAWNNFRYWEKKLKAAGYEPVNPMNHVNRDATHEEAMGICLNLLHWCDAALFQSNWVHSHGANEEMQYCTDQGIHLLSRNLF